MEGSIAPKERVNIVYKSVAGEFKEVVELPLKMLVMGNFTTKEDERPVEERQPIEITKGNLNEVMKGQDLSLDLSVPDKLSGVEDAEISMSLKFEEISDFSPDNIADQVPELKKIIDLRTALMAVKGPLGNVPAMRKTIQSIMDDDETRAKLIKELGIDQL
jgi:type VI secretion system protein ImpB